ALLSTRFVSCPFFAVPFSLSCLLLSSLFHSLACVSGQHLFFLICCCPSFSALFPYTSLFRSLSLRPSSTRILPFFWFHLEARAIVHFFLAASPVLFTALGPSPFFAVTLALNSLLVAFVCHSLACVYGQHPVLLCSCFCFVPS